MKISKTLGVALILAGIGLIAWVGLVVQKGGNLKPDLMVGAQTPAPSWRAEPIVPTAPPPETSTLGAQSSPTATPINTLALTPTSQRAEPPELDVSPTVSLASNRTARPSPTSSPMPPPVTPEVALRSLPPMSGARSRFGVGVPVPYLSVLGTQAAEELDLGWYLTWTVLETPPGPANVDFWQMIELYEGGYVPEAEIIQRVAWANPGATWLIGNEPDVRWQDNVTPARYAEWYYELYHLLKEADPTCRVAIGAISQPTPLRLQYLEMVLAAYQARYAEPMPVDVWNIHNFILREERDSWGVDIPPGMEVNQGSLFEVDDHDNIEVFRAQIIDFRHWMAGHGQRDKPLIVSEYGILMPEDYGFPLERVRRFMHSTYDFMLSAADPDIGYPADGNRLVQRWAWYSLGDDVYPTGNLIDLETGDLTGVGEAHQEFISQLQ